MKKINLTPIAVIKNNRDKIRDDAWGGVISEIVLADFLSEETLTGLEEFSHVEIIYYFHRVDESKINYSARHPRNNKNWPRVGIFAQRGKNRPNLLGHATAKLLRLENRSLFVEGLDAINGTPVLDIKPVMKEFLPNGEIVQPKWVSELMKHYWEPENL